MNAVIYLEGGAKGSKEMNIRCRAAFHKLLDRMGFKRKPSLVACGARNDVYERFRIDCKKNGYVAMWIDSEEPMADIEAAWQHLTTLPPNLRWEKPPGVHDDQGLFMTTCMETWIVADREALRTVFKQNLNENPLPALPDLERRPRDSVQDALKKATAKCSNPYEKGKRSFQVVEHLNPETLRKHLPSFARVERILKARL